MAEALLFDPQQVQEVCLFCRTFETSSIAPIQFPTQWIQTALSSVVTWPGLKANHSPPPNAKVKNICSYTSTTTMHLHGTHRNTFTITSNNSLNVSLKFSGLSTMHHYSNAANYNNISSTFKLQLKISNKNILLVICELSWWLGQNYAVHVCWK
jgi:hypothetical protein